MAFFYTERLVLIAFAFFINQKVQRINRNLYENANFERIESNILAYSLMTYMIIRANSLLSIWLVEVNLRGNLSDIFEVLIRFSFNYCWKLTATLDAVEFYPKEILNWRFEKMYLFVGSLINLSILQKLLRFQHILLWWNRLLKKTPLFGDVDKFGPKWFEWETPSVSQ